MSPPPLLDAHIHLWDLRGTPRETTPLVKLLGWNRSLLHGAARWVFPRDAHDFFGGPDSVLADYLPEQYGADAGGRVVGFVHVEAGWRGEGPLGPVDETRWLEGLGTPLLAAIVGYADLRLGAAVEEVLEAHLAASPRVRGIRYPLAHHPNAGIWNAAERGDVIGDPTWREGYARLADAGLHFEAAVYANQLPALLGLARAVPEVPMVICHAGTPAAYGGPFGGLGQTPQARSEIADAWRRSMAELAELAHVSVKLSGLAMPILGWGYDPTTVEAARVAHDIEPIVAFLVDHFGAERCLFGSNFPVDRVSVPWATLHDAFAQVLAGYTDGQRADLLYGTASRTYRIEASHAA